MHMKRQHLVIKFKKQVHTETPITGAVCVEYRKSDFRGWLHATYLSHVPLHVEEKFKASANNGLTSLTVPLCTVMTS